MIKLNCDTALMGWVSYFSITTTPQHAVECDLYGVLLYHLIKKSLTMNKPNDLDRKILETILFFLDNPYSGLEEYDAFREFLDTLPEEIDDATYFTIINAIDVERVILASNFSNFEYFDHVFEDNLEVFNDYVKKRFHSATEEMIEYTRLTSELLDCDNDELLILFNEIAYIYYEAAVKKEGVHE